MNKKTARYPKDLAKVETFNRFDMSELIEQQDLQNLERAAFELAGAYPFVFDALAYICTHHKDAIKDNEGETHYTVAIPVESFNDFALDGYDESYDYMRKELYQIIDKPEKKLMPLSKQYDIYTEPIRISVVHEKNKFFGNLARKKGAHKIKGFIINFYKPLFKPLLTGQYGTAWFPIPKAFHAKLIHTIKEYGHLPVFQQYGNFGHATNYRKLYFYLNLHDNSQSDKIYYDAIDLTARCLPSNIITINNTKYLREWFTTHQFLQKGLKLFNLMAKIGLMEGVKLIPESVFYEKPIKQIRVKIVRPEKDTAIPDFIDETNIDVDDFGY